MKCTLKTQKDVGEILDEYYKTATGEKLGFDIEVSIVMPWGEEFGEKIENKIKKSAPEENGSHKEVIEALKIAVAKMVERLWLQI